MKYRLYQNIRCLAAVAVGLALSTLTGCDSPPEAKTAEPQVRWADQRPAGLPQRPPLYDDLAEAIQAIQAQRDDAPAVADQPYTPRRYPGDETMIARLHLKEANVIDALRLISELTGINAVATREAGRQDVTLYLQNVSTIQAVENLCRVAGLWYRRDDESGAFRIMTTEQYQRDLIVFRNDRTRVLKLRFPNALPAATAIEDLYGDRVELSLGIDGDQFLFAGTGAGGVGATGLGQSNNRFDNTFARSGTGTTSRFGRTARLDEQDRLDDRADYRQYGDRDLRRELREDITAEQIARLERQVAEQGQDSALLSALTRGEPPIYVTVNREHNLLMIRTTDEQALSDISKLVAQIDRPTPQVLLEMKILELEVGDTFRSIFDVSYAEGDQSSGPDDGQPGNPLTGGATAATNLLGGGNFAAEGGTLVYQFLNDSIRARIQLLQRDNRLNVVAAPLLLASNNRPARVFVGEQRVLTTGVETDIIVPEGGATTTLIEPITEVRDIGNSIIILPKINADRSVTLLVNQDASSIIPDSSTIPVATSGGGIEEFAVDAVRTSQLQGIVVARDGLTVAIGGLIRSEINDLEEKVPVLGDLPIAGTAFRKEVRERRKTELVLLITPHVLMTPGQADTVTRETLDKLSQHPYLKTGDATNQQYFRNTEKVLEPDSPLDRKPESE
jgi:general secretion pathway protein D